MSAEQLTRLTREITRSERQFGEIEYKIYSRACTISGGKLATRTLASMNFNTHSITTKECLRECSGTKLLLSDIHQALSEIQPSENVASLLPPTVRAMLFLKRSSARRHRQVAPRGERDP